MAARARARRGRAGVRAPVRRPDVVAGQGSLGLELLEDVPDLAQGRRAGRRRRAVRRRRDRGQVRAPGRRGRRRAGRGLRALPRVAAARRARSRPPGADDRRRHRGQAPRRAHAARCSSAGSTTWSSSARTRSAEAMVVLLERAKLVVEGAGAVGVAALLGGQVRAGRVGHHGRGALGRQRRRRAAGRRSRAATRPRPGGALVAAHARCPTGPATLAAPARLRRRHGREHRRRLARPRGRRPARARDRRRAGARDPRDGARGRRRRRHGRGRL